jgi:FAD binding domain
VRKRLCGIPKEKAPPLMTAAEKTHEMDKAKARDFDVVVVGTGIAGLSTAVAALQSGASVALLERSAREERGGNTRWTEALLRMKSETEVSDDFEEHFAKNAGHHLDPELVGETTRAHRDWPSIVKTLGFTDPDLVATFAQGVGPTIQWLKTFGVRFDFLPTYFITSSQPRMAPVGGGLALIEALAAFAGDKDARFFYETTARGLVQDEHGVVVGVRAVQQGNKALTLRACSVVLACGGFQGNSEMLTHYIGPRARYIRPGTRWLLRQRRRHTHGSGDRRRSLWRLRSFPRRASRSAFGRTGADRSRVQLRHPGQHGRATLRRRGSRNGGRDLRGDHAHGA